MGRGRRSMLKRLGGLTGAALLFLTCGGHAQSSLSVRDYQQLRRHKSEEIKIYIMGLGTGFSWMNVRIRSEGRPPMYCPPGKLHLNSETYFDILDKELKRKGVTDSWIEVELLNGLIHTFPCR
jgi:hypothetical protein